MHHTAQEVMLAAVCVPLKLDYLLERIGLEDVEFVGVLAEVH